MIARQLLKFTVLATILSCNFAVAQQPSSQENGKCQIPIYKGRDPDRRARILAKPEPEYTAIERRQYFRDYIKLRAVLCGSGEVMEIVVTSGLAPDIDLKAVDAARRIKFVPGEKDGQSISTLVTLLYRVK